MLALVLDPVVPDLDIERGVLSGYGIDVSRPASPAGPTPDELAGADALLITEVPRINRDLLDLAPRCRIVAAFGAGYDNVDLAVARARGIVVTHVPDYCTEEVADHTMGLILAVWRRLAEGNSLMRAGAWGVEHLGVVHRLRGRTLGIVGFGRIGRAVATRAAPFGLRVVAWTRHARNVPAAVEVLASFDALLARSDVLSLHLPLATETTALLDAAAIARLPTGAIVVNTSRGALVDMPALVRAINQGHLAGAGLDVYPSEPPDLAGLALDDRVVLTPHVAWYSAEAVEESRSRAALAVARCLTGGPVPDRVA
ncbi:MAG: C-terminal binding protein [Candidatus Limnocylindrales bacterium]